MMRTFEEAFADFFFEAILIAGGDRSTAHKCVGLWWEAVERQRENPEESKR